jgi:hypothetical protein
MINGGVRALTAYPVNTRTRSQAIVAASYQA